MHGGRPHSPRLSARRVAMQQASIRTLLNVNGIIDNVDRTERLRLAVRSRICPYDSQEISIYSRMRQDSATLRGPPSIQESGMAATNT